MNYFIIHGAYGNNQENWFPWLEHELKKISKEVYNLNYPTPINQNFISWSNILNSKKDKIGEDSVFFCHSIGCVFLAKYCIENNIKIKRCVFVSGFNNYFFNEKFDEINRDMFCDNIKEFSKLCGERICIFSKNDPYINFENLKEFSKSFKGQEIIIENGAHFNSNAGYEKFLKLLDFIN